MKMYMKTATFLYALLIGSCTAYRFNYKRSSNDIDILQTPACHEAKGVCAPVNLCTGSNLHSDSSLCVADSGHGCCITMTPTTKEAVEMPSCTALQGQCVWGELCGSGMAHENTLLCGDQSDVVCCPSDAVVTPGTVSNAKRAHAKRTDEQVSVHGNRNAFQPELLNFCELRNGVCQETDECAGNELTSNVIDLCRPIHHKCCSNEVKRSSASKRAGPAVCGGDGQCTDPSDCQDGMLSMGGPATECSDGFGCCFRT